MPIWVGEVCKKQAVQFCRRSITFWKGFDCPPAISTREIRCDGSSAIPASAIKVDVKRSKEFATTIGSRTVSTVAQTVMLQKPRITSRSDRTKTKSWPFCGVISYNPLAFEKTLGVDSRPDESEPHFIFAVGAGCHFLIEHCFQPVLWAGTSP